MDPKEMVLAELSLEYADFKRTFRGLDEAQLTRPMLGTWSVREILVHVSGWHREMARALDRMAGGERPIPEGVSYDDADAWNERFVQSQSGASIREALEELDHSYRAFMEAARALPAERFAPGRTAERILRGTGPEHYREHGAQILTWRQRERV